VHFNTARTAWEQGRFAVGILPDAEAAGGVRGKHGERDEEVGEGSQDTRVDTRVSERIEVSTAAYAISHDSGTGTASLIDVSSPTPVSLSSDEAGDVLERRVGGVEGKVAGLEGREDPFKVRQSGLWD
jgi:hypothetical protein